MGHPQGREAGRSWGGSVPRERGLSMAGAPTLHPVPAVNKGLVRRTPPGMGKVRPPRRKRRPKCPEEGRPLHAPSETHTDGACRGQAWPRTPRPRSGS